jgi:hypothetical protein
MCLWFREYMASQIVTLSSRGRPKVRLAQPPVVVGHDATSGVLYVRLQPFDRSLVESGVASNPLREIPNISIRQP